MKLFLTQERVDQALSAFERIAPGFKPEVAMILGSGMSPMGGAIQDAVSVGYEEIPNMALSTCYGHFGRFLLGTLSGKKVICMQGRLHPYEGYSAQQIAFPVYVMKQMGAKTLIITNAAGGIDPSYNVGDLMLIKDHINFQSLNPILGPVPELGNRFFDMTEAYSPKLRELAMSVAKQQDFKVHEGVYISVLGPSFETPAEIRAFGVMGADAVGMSTVQEVIAANQQGMDVLGISLISNPAAGVCDEPLDIQDVSNAAHIAAANMEELITDVLAKL